MLRVLRLWRLAGQDMRLLWFALCPARGISQMPAGWFRGHYGDIVTLKIPACPLEIPTLLESLLEGRTAEFGQWVLGRSAPELPLFEKAMLQADIEFLTESFI